ncbi:MAG: polymerase subunit sigma, partial [Verrucomicrobiales bacterium]|nr:polymerase subunit sigma [Verrucomicrobiales bacterium]
AASEAMRRILVDHARKKNSQKRGSGVSHEELDESSIVLTVPADELLAVNDALDALQAEDSDAAELVKLRYFVGMTMDECASAMNLAPRTAERLWAYARAWLKKEIKSKE